LYSSEKIELNETAFTDVYIKTYEPDVEQLMSSKIDLEEVTTSVRVLKGLNNSFNVYVLGYSEFNTFTYLRPPTQSTFSLFAFMNSHYPLVISRIQLTSEDLSPEQMGFLQGITNEMPVSDFFNQLKEQSGTSKILKSEKSVLSLTTPGIYDEMKSPIAPHLFDSIAMNSYNEYLSPEVKIGSLKEAKDSGRNGSKEIVSMKDLVDLDVLDSSTNNELNLKQWFVHELMGEFMRFLKTRVIEQAQTSTLFQQVKDIETRINSYMKIISDNYKKTLESFFEKTENKSLLRSILNAIAERSDLDRLFHQNKTELENLINTDASLPFSLFSLARLQFYMNQDYFSTYFSNPQDFLQDIGINLHGLLLQRSYFFFASEMVTLVNKCMRIILAPKDPDTLKFLYDLTNPVFAQIEGILSENIHGTAMEKVFGDLDPQSNEYKFLLETSSESMSYVLSLRTIPLRSWYYTDEFIKKLIFPMAKKLYEQFDSDKYNNFLLGMTSGAKGAEVLDKDKVLNSIFLFGGNINSGPNSLSSDSYLFLKEISDRRSILIL
jgi:hypothetical protein